MAVKLAKKNNVFNMQQRTFYIDDESDLDAIEAEYDCGIGDTAECPDGTIYRRHSDDYEGDLWEKKGASKGGGGSTLPDVDSEDNGKVLKVVDGEWDKSTGDTIIIHLNNDDLTDMTWQEMHDALLAGKRVVMMWGSGTTVRQYIFTTTFEASGMYVARFMAVSSDVNNRSVVAGQLVSLSANGYLILD